MTRQRYLLLIGAGLIAIILIVVAAFILMRPTSNEPVVSEDVPASANVPVTSVPAEDTPGPPEPTSWFFPLTGVETNDKEATLRRTLSVKIENTPMARPQTGLSSADVIYETVTEGGITRFNCLFQSRIPEEVGPVRSARLSDLSIVPQYDALFFFSGANSYVNSEIKSAELANMAHSKVSSLYHRVGYREAPHNLYLSLAASAGPAAEKGFATTAETPRGLEFANDAGAAVGTGAGASASGDGSATAGASSNANTSAETERANLPNAAHIFVTFSYSYVAEWTWDDASQTYRRSMDEATIDAATNEQIAATNLIVLRTSYTDAPDDKTLFLSLNGKGDATLFIDGKRIDGTWESDGATPPRFKDANGTPILLTPGGTTWFQVLDPTWDLTVTN
jgi:hypothetical protein